MSPIFTCAVTATCLLVAVWLGMRIRRLLPAHHLSADTKDTVKLAMGLVATMSALVLGLLVSSAKSSYDTTRGEVLQMAAKVAFLDRVLAAYGPEAAATRNEFHAAVELALHQMWSGETGGLARLAGHTAEGDLFYATLQNLSPKNDMERSLKAQAISLGVELAQLRTLLMAQAVPSVSKPLLIVVVAWLVVIFLSFSLLAPPNATASLTLMVSALSVAGALFLVLELDQPFGGLLRISSDPMRNALSQTGTPSPP